MTKQFLKKCWLSLGSLLVIGAAVVLACADGWWPEYGTSAFTPEAFAEKPYSPFFYSGNYYYGIGHDNEQTTRFNNTNVAEWAGYLKSNDSATIYYLLNTADSITVKAIYQYHQKKTDTLPADARSFALLQARPQKELSIFLHYLLLAKTAETFANKPYYWWGNESDSAKPYFDATAFDAALQSAFDAAAGNTFIQQRICFQQIRNWYFNQHAQRAIDLFETKGKAYPKNTLYYRSLSYAAGALHRLKRWSEANYYFSLVYAQCDALKTTAHFSFKPQEEKDWQATLALCQHNKERATLWQMLGIFYGDEKRSITAIYTLDAKGDGLELLLSRAINKEEQRLYGDYGGMKFAKTAKPNVSPALLALVNTIAKAGKTAQPLAWHCAAGYLQMLNGNFKAADASLRTAASITTTDTLQQWQLRLLQLLNKTAAASRVDAAMEKALLADLSWLTNMPDATANSFRYSDAFIYIKQRLADLYQKQGEPIKAACFVTAGNFYAQGKNTAALRNFLLKPNKTAYEQICEKLCPYKADDLFEHEAIQLAFTNQLPQAIASLMQSNQRAQYQLKGNPFNGKINDCHDCEHEAYRGNAYTKISLLQKMNNMQEQLSSGKDVYNNALLLGNAFYNISHYGNARLFYESAILGSGHYAPFAIDTAYRKTLTSMQWATHYYQKALQAATNNEQKARCTYLLAKCERNEWYNKHVYANKAYSYDNDMLNLKAMAQFKALQQYKDTKYYNEVIAECGYFRRYTGR
jgi:hypothetical protein